MTHTRDIRDICPAIRASVEKKMATLFRGIGGDMEYLAVLKARHLRSTMVRIMEKES